VETAKTPKGIPLSKQDGEPSMTAVTLNTEPRMASRRSRMPESEDACTAAERRLKRTSPQDERIVKTLVEIARATKSHQIIVAGSNCSEVFLELHRLEYSRVSTTKTCRIPYTQYDIALLAWQEHSIKALATTLDWLVHFLSPTGALVIWIDTAARARSLRSAIEQLGFRVETAVRCENGFATSARRLDIGRQTIVAQGDRHFAGRSPACSELQARPEAVDAGQREFAKRTNPGVSTRVPQRWYREDKGHQRTIRPD
jgi:hypothetical protein